MNLFFQINLFSLRAVKLSYKEREERKQKWLRHEGDEHRIKQVEKVESRTPNEV